MPTERPYQPPASPVPGVIPEPVRVQHDRASADERPAVSDPRDERDARRRERETRRGPAGKRPAVTAPRNRKSSPLEAPSMRLAATAGIVAIAVALAALLSTQGAPGWLIGLAASAASLMLAALLWSPRRR
ncbi:MAG TPA: hypothetical protein VFZ00_32020 [Solirubrobacter sp.]|nr:hypothetical protein [Solirubrobacter sp.]